MTYFFSTIKRLYITLLLLFFSSCGILVGNVKPVTEKSSSYSIQKLDENSENYWKKISRDKISYNSDEPEFSSPDVTYQSTKNSSIISLNSSCKTINVEQQNSESLEKISDLLILGVTEIKDKKQEFLEIDRHPALETSLTGKLNDQRVSIKSVITRRGSCIFDFMYISQPEFFNVHMATFSQFVASFHVN